METIGSKIFYSSLILIAVGSVSTKNLILVGKNQKTFLTHYTEFHTPKIQHCFSKCHYDKSCYSLEVVQTTLYHCKFHNQFIKRSNRTTESNTNIYSEIRSCDDLFDIGIKNTGAYEMNFMGEGKKMIRCYFDEDGGWLVFQRRVDASVNFNIGWDFYKNGFGDPRGSFWLGNDLIHEVTNQAQHQIRIVLTNFTGGVSISKYDHFEVASEAMKYQLTATGFSQGFKLFKRYDGMFFTTTDRDNDIIAKNCAKLRTRGGFWYEKCGDFFPNGVYYEESDSFKPDPYLYHGIRYTNWNSLYTLKSVEMMIKRKE
uniref:Fibrinogen C-terminal domain-containing protein n=1 Tax=Clytia hemisphaerica TaxID=252671 RepID=A0A7M5UYX9_9CNID